MRFYLNEAIKMILEIEKQNKKLKDIIELRAYMYKIKPIDTDGSIIFQYVNRGPLLETISIEIGFDTLEREISARRIIVEKCRTELSDYLYKCWNGGMVNDNT